MPMDALNDGKFEALRIAQALGEKLDGVRFDAPTVNFGLDLAKVDRRPFAKRGKETGASSWP